MAIPYRDRNNLKEFCIEKILPEKTVCCRKKRSYLAMLKARKHLAKETNIVSII